MKVLCAPNALKGTLSAPEAARAMARGVRSALPGAEVVELPIADGGDGTALVLVEALNGVERETQALDPLGRLRRATYGLVGNGATVVVDVASASGLAALSAGERDARRATSFGTGQLLGEGLASGARDVILGVGGSATVDGGAGLVSALGGRFLDADGAALPPGGAALARLWTIELSGLEPALLDATVTVACDVDNPLLGDDGAARVFGPQKGASERDVVELEAALERLATVLESLTSRDVRALRHGGAAGGIAATLHAVLGARLTSGIDLVLDVLRFDERAAGADLVITSEGRFDRSSFGNKGPVGVARRAQRLGVPTIALVGSVDPTLAAESSPFSAVEAISPERTTPSELAARSAEWLERAAARKARELAGRALG